MMSAKAGKLSSDASMTESKASSIAVKIATAACTVGTITFAVKIVSLLKEYLLARTFGTGDALDAFLVAFVLPFFATSVIAGSFNTALIPTFIRIRDNEGNSAAQALLSNTLFWNLLLLVIVLFVLLLTSGLLIPVMASGFNNEKLILTRNLFIIMCPAVVISGMSASWSAVLNAGERFALVAATPVITPLVMVVALFVSGKTFGVYSLAIAVVTGASLEALVLAIALKGRGFQLSPKWSGLTEPTKEVMKQYWPMLAGSVLMSSTTLIDQSMAGALKSGSVAALNYGNRIVSLSLNIGAVAIGTSVLPFFSKMASENDWNAIKQTFKFFLKLITAFSLPFTLALILSSRFLVSFFYQHGRFTSEDVSVVTTVQIFYALQIPFYVLSILAVRLISTLRANHILMWGAVINLVVDISCNVILMRHFGVAGIALSTAIVYAISLAFISWMLYLQLQKASIDHG